VETAQSDLQKRTLKMHRNQYYRQSRKHSYNTIKSYWKPIYHCRRNSPVPLLRSSELSNTQYFFTLAINNPNQITSKNLVVSLKSEHINQKVLGLALFIIFS